VRAIGAGELRACFTELCNLFKLHSHDILNLVIDGSQAAQGARIKVTSWVAGKTVATELVDFIELKEERIVSFRQSCDTALAARLVPISFDTSLLRRRALARRPPSALPRGGLT